MNISPTFPEPQHLLRQDIEEAKQALADNEAFLAAFNVTVELTEPDRFDVEETLALSEGRPLRRVLPDSTSRLE